MAEEIFKYITTLLKKEPLSTIYHYTDQKGLLGIIESKSIWATNIHYLNDATEFSYAIDMARSELRKYRKTLDDETERNLTTSLENQLETIERINICVCSFSEKGDLLSQWRGYCQSGSGFSLGFDYSDLRDAIKKQGFILAPCVYDPKKQHTIIQELIAKTILFYINEKEKSGADDKVIEGLSNEFVKDLVRFGPVIKHPSFSEEKEWRLISPPVPVNHPQIKHREANSLITPYFDFELTSGENLSIPKIIIGPNPHMELAISAIAGLMSAKQIKWGQVEPSTIPYRTL